MSTVAQRVTRIYQNVRTHVPGVLDSVVQLEFYNALDELLKDSNLWQQALPFAVVSVTTGPVSYTITPNDGIINRLMWVKNSNGDLLSDFTMPVPGVLIKQNAPSQAETFTANVALTVIDPLDQNNWPIVSDWILDKYFGVLADGTVGKLMLQGKKPYSDQQMGIYYTRRFRNGVALARSEAIRMNDYGVSLWRFPGTYSVRRKKM